MPDRIGQRDLVRLQGFGHGMPAPSTDSLARPAHDIAGHMKPDMFFIISMDYGRFLSIGMAAIGRTHASGTLSPYSSLC